MRDCHSKSRINLTPDFQKDLNWFLTFLYTFNGVSYIYRPSMAQVYVDASPYGFGAICNNQVYAVPYNQGYFSHASIVHLEMYNVFLALQVWAPQWQNSKVCVFCDNQAVVAALTTLRIRDSFLMTIARNIWLLSAQFDIELQFQYVNTKLNVYADILSRWFTPAIFKLDYVEYLRECEWMYIPHQLFPLDNSL